MDFLQEIFATNKATMSLNVSEYDITLSGPKTRPYVLFGSQYVKQSFFWALGPPKLLCRSLPILGSSSVSSILVSQVVLVVLVSLLSKYPMSPNSSVLVS